MIRIVAMFMIVWGVYDNIDDYNIDDVDDDDNP